MFCFVLFFLCWRKNRFFLVSKSVIQKRAFRFAKRDCHAPSCRAAPCWILDAEESGASLAPFPPHSCPFLWETKEKNMPTMTAFSFPSHGEKREMKATCRRQKKRRPYRMAIRGRKKRKIMACVKKMKLMKALVLF